MVASGCKGYPGTVGAVTRGGATAPSCNGKGSGCAVDTRHALRIKILGLKFRLFFVENVSMIVRQAWIFPSAV